MLLRAFNHDTANFNGPYYTSAWNMAKELGIMRNIPDEPEGFITREEMFTITLRLLQKYGWYKEEAAYGWLYDFSDYADTSEYAYDSLSILIANKLVSGSDNQINPKGYSLRSEAAQFLYNVIISMSK